MDRDEAIFAELASPHMQDAVSQVDIRAVEAQRFAGPQPRARSQPDQHGQRPATLRLAWRDALDGREE